MNYRDRIGGYGPGHQGIQSHTLPTGGILVERAQQYFGLPLHQLAQMPPEQLAQFADRARAMKQLRKHLPILQKHFSELIQGQVEYEQFMAEVLKEVNQGSKSIDKSALDNWLAAMGYTRHLATMNQKAAHGQALVNQEMQSELNLAQLDFSSAMQLIHAKHQRKAREIQQKVPLALNQMDIQQQIAFEERRNRELIQYGTQGKPGANLNSKLTNFFWG